MSTTTLDTEILSPSERDRLLQAMADSCAELGYGETTVEGVLERSGLDREAFSSHFADKEDCALAALNRIVSESLAAVSTVDAAPTEQERRMLQVRALLELTEVRRSYARLGFIEARHGATERLRDGYEAAVHVLALMMERAQAGGTRPPVSAARGALGGAEAVVRRELCRAGSGNLPARLPDFVYAALVPFLGQREALRQAKLAAQLLAEEG
jgi:AcrR family transcriptional regulator